MYKIISRIDFNETIIKITILANQIAKKCRPGQFVMLRVSENGERIPLTIYNYDREKGTIDLIYQVVGVTTHKLSKLGVNDDILDLAGPLGTPVNEIDAKRILAIAGGLGIAPLLAQLRDYKQKNIISIYGAQSKSNLILKSELEGLSDKVFYYTNDGSFGKSGFVTKDLDKIIKDFNPQQVLAIGPIPMMESVVSITKKYNLSTRVSLNPIMIDGTGMCGGCRVKIGEETKLACVDGPEFEGLLVDFSTLKSRSKMFDESRHNCEIK
jgi:ferredoxin--NADP+ reductase